MQHYLIPYGELLILQGSGSIRRTNRQNCTATVVSFALALRRLSNQVADLDDVAPVTPHSAEIEQNKARPSFFACAKTESDHGCQSILSCLCSPNATFKESNRSPATGRKCITTLPISLLPCGAIFVSVVRRSRTSQVQTRERSAP